MKYIAVLGRQPEISLAELEALFGKVFSAGKELARFNSVETPNIDRLGGCIKIAEKLNVEPLEFLRTIEDGKITLGVSDFSRGSSARKSQSEALKLKKILLRHGRSVRVVENKDAVLSTATSLHNGLSGKNPRKIELLKIEDEWYRVIGVQDIDAYARRDQARPARDAKVGMLPPKLAQILINLCGDLKKDSRILDPFCGTGVVLQESLLMGYTAYGTDLEPRMIDYSKRNLEWFTGQKERYDLEVGDATAFKWNGKIDAVACEGYLGSPMSNAPAEIKLKAEKQNCSSIVLGFLKNISTQIKSGTPVTIAAPAWLREDGSYSRMKIHDEIEEIGFEISPLTRGKGLLYYREGQVVARDILILKKK